MPGYDSKMISHVELEHISGIRLCLQLYPPVNREEHEKLQIEDIREALLEMLNLFKNENFTELILNQIDSDVAIKL